MNALKSFLETFLGPGQILTASGDIEEYGQDRTRFYDVKSQCVVFPKSSDELSKILKYCYENEIAVVPSGGRTGLAGAAVAANNELVISLSKMSRIIEVDEIGATVEVEAGATIESIHTECAKKNLYFPLDFAAKGSAQIGGCISTNAGGIKVIKYGMTRDLVLGLEVVLIDGTIMDLNKKLIKDNSGYALTQLFIGAEGTLGIITKASLKCVSPVKNSSLGLFAVENFEAIPKILRIIREESDDVLSFEFFTNSCKNIVLSHVESAEYPFEDDYPYFVLLELMTDFEQLEEVMEVLADKELIVDATISSSSVETENLWSLRESISESISMSGNVYKNDISVPVSELASFIPDLKKLVSEKYKEFELLLFGHIADGNIHVNILDRENLKKEEFKSKLSHLDNEMYALVKRYNGSISAEHGIGLLKKEGLKVQRTDMEIKLMKGLKNIFDHKNLMNPGKIFD